MEKSVEALSSSSPNEITQSPETASCPTCLCTVHRAHAGLRHLALSSALRDIKTSRLKACAENKGRSKQIYKMIIIPRVGVTVKYDTKDKKKSPKQHATNLNKI